MLEFLHIIDLDQFRLINLIEMILEFVKTSLQQVTFHLNILKSFHKLFLIP